MSKHFERLEIGIARLSHIAMANENGVSEVALPTHRGPNLRDGMKRSAPVGVRQATENGLLFRQQMGQVARIRQRFQV